MKFKSTWILIVVLVAIASYYFLVEERKRAAGDRESKTSKEILPYTWREVYRFVLINPKGERIEIEQTDAGWMIISPVLTAADSSTIATLLGELVPGHKLDSITGAANLADYGLDTPFATIIFFAEGHEHPDTIYVGDKTPTSISCYIRINSTDTVLIAREMTHNITNKSIYYLRDKFFLGFPSSEIDSFRVTADGADLFLVRRGETWWLSDPAVRADTRLIENYLNGLTRTLIRGFPREEKSGLERFGLDRPTERIVLHRGTSKVEIDFGAQEENLVYAVRTGLSPVVQLEQKLLDAFGWTRKQIRALDLSPFEMDEIDTIRYETPDTTIVLERNPDGWLVHGGRIFGGDVGTFLGKLSRVKYTSIAEEGYIFDPLDPFSVRITLLGGGGNVVDRILLLDEKGPREEGASLSSNCRGQIEPGVTADLRLLIEGH